MSTALYYLRRARFGYKAGNDLLIDPNTESEPRSQPKEIFGCIESMGSTAENLINKYSISRKNRMNFLWQAKIKQHRQLKKLTLRSKLFL